MESACCLSAIVQRAALRKMFDVESAGYLGPSGRPIANSTHLSRVKECSTSLRRQLMAVVNTPFVEMHNFEYKTRHCESSAWLHYSYNRVIEFIKKVGRPNLNAMIENF